CISTLPDALVVTSAPQVLSTNRVGASSLFVNVTDQAVLINGTGFQSPTSSPLGVLFSGTGITVKQVKFFSSSQIEAAVDCDADAAVTSRTITVVNPDLGTGTSAGVIVALATPPATAPVGLAPSKTTSSPPMTPTLSGLTPTAGPLGSSVTLTGTGFSTT